MQITKSKELSALLEGKYLDLLGRVIRADSKLTDGDKIYFVVRFPSSTTEDDFEVREAKYQLILTLHQGINNVLLAGKDLTWR